MKPKYPRINADRDRLYRFYLCEDVEVTLLSGKKIVIAEGFRFDGHTLPTWKSALVLSLTAFIFGAPLTLAGLIFFAVLSIRAIFPVYDYDIFAALVHDYLVAYDRVYRMKRVEVDREYHRLMQEYQATRLRTWLFPKAVFTWGYLKRGVWGL